MVDIPMPHSGEANTGSDKEPPLPPPEHPPPPLQPPPEFAMFAENIQNGDVTDSHDSEAVVSIHFYIFTWRRY